MREKNAELKINYDCGMYYNVQSVIRRLSESANLIGYCTA